MTPAQIRTVRASFARIEPKLTRLGNRFYRRLFLIAPELRTMLGDDMAVRETTFMTVVSELVNLHLRSLLSLPAVGGSAAIPALAQLGRNYAAMGVRLEHFAPMRAALLDVLSQDFADHLTAEARAAWMAAFDVLAQAMQAGMKGAPAEQEQFLGRFSEKSGQSAHAPAAPASALQQFFQ
jgi:hemoglobin-like flavoprotein